MHICEDIEPYKDTNSPSTTCGLHVLLPCFVLFFFSVVGRGQQHRPPTIFKHLDKHNNSAILEMKTQDRIKKESQSNKLLLLLFMSIRHFSSSSFEKKYKNVLLLLGIHTEKEKSFRERERGPAQQYTQILTLYVYYIHTPVMVVCVLDRCCCDAMTR